MGKLELSIPKVFGVRPYFAFNTSTIASGADRPPCGELPSSHRGDQAVAIVAQRVAYRTVEVSKSADSGIESG